MTPTSPPESFPSTLAPPEIRTSFSAARETHFSSPLMWALPARMPPPTLVLPELWSSAPQLRLPSTWVLPEVWKPSRQSRSPLTWVAPLQPKLRQRTLPSILALPLIFTSSYSPPERTPAPEIFISMLKPP